MSEVKFKACDLRANAIVVQEHDFDRATAERDALQQRLTAADERADALESVLRELLAGSGNSPGANKKYGKARAVLEGLSKKEDSRIGRLEVALKFYANREHYHFESGKWDTVSGEPLNILWNGDEPDFIEDGAVARAALKPAEGRGDDWLDH